MHDISREAVIEGKIDHKHKESESFWTSEPEKIEPFFSPALSVILISLSFFLGGDKTSIGINLSLAACALSGLPIIKNSIRAIFEDKRLNAEFLVTLALFASIWVGEYLAGAIVVLMMNVGELLEDITIAKTGDAIRKLIEITPDYATVIRGGREITVSTEEVQKGELVIVKPGEKIPVDGIVERGFAEVDESAITGEALPVNKEEGNGVFSGTINKNGVIIVRATRVGSQTTLAKIIEMVKEAQSKKPPIERIADRFSGWFTPAILLFSAIVYLITGEILRAVSILVVACPCALVIATPTAVVAGIGNAARKGILIKGGAILENMGKLTSFVFDKTGTVTLGVARVDEIKSFSTFSEDAVLELAAIAEKHSTHSLANAILSKAEEKGLIITPPDKSKTIVGKGVKVISGNDEIIIGNPLMFKDENIELPEEVCKYIDTKANEGNTTVCVGFNGKLAGVISISDTIRKEVSETINDLKSLGAKSIVMLTGDRKESAKKISEGIGFDRVEAELLPEDKVLHITKMKETGEIVAMIGDGINDAPALALADVGIAMGTGGTDIAIESADIALVSDDISKVTEGIAIGKKTIQIIKQSLAISIVINALALYFASSGLLGPIGGAIVHNIGSFVVVGNSARLISYSFKK
ncbi:MAG: cadmium-translocating P-type ATPase [Candidatus Schekmanbacteria bacterium]|nr:MAG: cadmium-translocating P-type ATPase [Candidatus Schekmanbacteria bacterium]